MFYEGYLQQETVNMMSRCASLVCFIGFTFQLHGYYKKQRYLIATLCGTDHPNLQSKQEFCLVDPAASVSRMGSGQKRSAAHYLSCHWLLC
jgi:hypothetical protein